MAPPYRLAILTSHPIQYQAPFFRDLAKRPDVDLTVLFCDRFGLESYRDTGFGVQVRWDVPLSEGYRHRFLPNRSAWPAPGRFWGLINPGVIGELRAGHFDALVVHGWARATYWLALVAADVLRIPVLLRGESNGLFEPTGAKLLVKRLLLRGLFRRVAGFLAIGTLNRRFYHGYGVNSARICLAPYSVDNDFFQSAAGRLIGQRAQLRRSEGIPEEATVFLYCGKLSSQKRPLDVLEAFARLPDMQRCFLVYAGDGALRASVEERCRQLSLRNVCITGFRNQSELPRWYSLADAVVVPSEREPWGLVVNEAMNFGLPIVASDQVGAVPDLVCNGVNGFSYPAGDVASLTRRLSTLVSDSGLRAAMGMRSLQRIQAWGIRDTVDGYCSALHALAADQR